MQLVLSCTLHPLCAELRTMLSCCVPADVKPENVMLAREVLGGGSPAADADGKVSGGGGRLAAGC